MDFSFVGKWVVVTALIPTILFLLTIALKGLSFYIVKNIEKVNKLSNILYIISALFWNIGIAIVVLGSLILMIRRIF